jgi:diguanylate cyclase (GGDEF)-like protein
MTGWTSEEAAGCKVGEIFALFEETSSKLTVNPVAECLSKGRRHYLDGDTILIGRSGDRRDVRASAAPVRTPEGAIIGAVLVLQDVAASRALRRQLAHTAMHDDLTGLPNRATFQQALAGALQQARSEAREHTLCFIDLDHFKTINDNAGHGTGDAVLREIGTAIRATCRTHDFAARIGGDEFALLLPDCSVESATRVAQKIIDAIARLRLSLQATCPSCMGIGASVGITAVTSRSPDAAELMREADAACYVAKARGRNCFATYDGGRPGLSQLQASA